MSVTPGFLAFVEDQLSPIVELRSRRMFGGVGLYAGDLFFALIADDVLYLKVDDHNRPDFEERGLEPFRPFGDDAKPMQYYEVPGDLLEDGEALRPWVEKSVEVARRAAGG